MLITESIDLLLVLPLLCVRFRTRLLLGLLEFSLLFSVFSSKSSVHGCLKIMCVARYFIAVNFSSQTGHELDFPAFLFELSFSTVSGMKRSYVLPLSVVVTCLLKPNFPNDGCIPTET